MPTLRYEICDVFTDRPLTGNPLAVFTDGRELDAPTMQALARELNLSETTFVLPPRASDADAHVRIFTPHQEIPFAGHPTLGTAFVLSPIVAGDTVRLETARGVIPVRFTRRDADSAFGWMSQPLPSHAPFEHAAELLAALRVARSELPVERYDNGPQHLIVQASDAQTVAALRPDLSRLAALGNFVVTVCAALGERWKSRVFAPGGGIAEDPATGSAAGPLAVHLARHGRIRFGQEIVIEQGAELQRPSSLHARALGSAAQLAAVEVGGSALRVARGEFQFA